VLGSFVDPLSYARFARLERSIVLPDTFEATFLEHSNRGDVRLGHVGVERPGFELQKVGEGLRGNALTPKCLSEPIPQTPLTFDFEAGYVPGDLSSIHDRLGEAHWI